jgi:hypothetical protein
MNKAVMEHQSEETSDYGLIHGKALCYIVLNDSLNIAAPTFAIVEAILQLSITVMRQAKRY